MSEIEKIASKHLGKAGDGTVVKPYITPDCVDPTLLVGIPRELNRVGYNITNNDFDGYDIWNCYEVSTLTDSGMPVNAVVQLRYSSASPVIVESKSLKLYLNSFNMYKQGRGFDQVISSIKSRITLDFAEQLGLAVDVHVHGLKGWRYDTQPNRFQEWDNLESECELNGYHLDFNRSSEDPSVLSLRNVVGVVEGYHHSYSLRSNCRVTNQPDWGDIFIYYKANGKEIEAQGLLEYIVSMRKENHFHEEICECVYKRLSTLLGEHMQSLLVVCLYTRRGGIDINPVRMSDESDFEIRSILNDLLGQPGCLFKTERQ